MGEEVVKEQEESGNVSVTMSLCPNVHLSTTPVCTSPCLTGSVSPRGAIRTSGAFKQSSRPLSRRPASSP